MNRPLRTEAEIRAAGADAVRGWQLNDKQIDQMVALINPVRDEVWRPLNERDTTADAA